MTVIATFIAWFYIRVLAGAISQRTNGGQRMPRLRGARTLSLAMLVIALASTGTATVARERQADGAFRPKVVVVVGPVGPRTAEYGARGRALAAHARGLGADVIGIYPPRATWNQVSRAARGADLFVYMGHGNGWPSPYPPFQTETKNGLGLNAYEGAPSGSYRYHGERYVDDLGLSKDAVVLLVGLCYSSGNAEPGMAIPSRAVAQERVDNYGAGFLRAGARAVFSDGFSDSSYLLDDLFHSDRSMRSIFWASWRASGVDASTFRSERTPGMAGILDPRPDGDYYHSFIGDPDFRASEWRGGPEPADEEPQPPRDEEPPRDKEPPGDEDEDPDDDPGEPAVDRRRATGHLNLRNGPGTSHRIIGWVLRGTKILVLETREHGTSDWLRVRLPSGEKGWVWSGWVSSR
ncbi:MAG: SH3 domain-containing protein [Chloroflexota bacterium]|nr:SH3 domain-containing protein [Chloroflexota bacterium]